MTRTRRTRRRFLQVSLAGLTAGLAGCGLPGGEEGEDDEGGENGGEEGTEGGDEEGGGEEGGEGDDDRAPPEVGPGA